MVVFFLASLILTASVVVSERRNNHSGLDRPGSRRRRSAWPDPASRPAGLAGVRSGARGGCGPVAEQAGPSVSRNLIEFIAVAVPVRVRRVVFWRDCLA